MNDHHIPIVYTKTTFLQMRSQCHFDIIALAWRANVHPEGVYRMPPGEPVPCAFAEKVLGAFSEHARTICTLENVDVPLAS